MERFEEEEQQRKELEARLNEFRKSEQGSKEFTPWKGLYLIGSLGFAVAASLVVGLGLGAYLDNRFGTKPWLTLCGLIFGLLASFKASYELVRSTLKNKD